MLRFRVFTAILLAPLVVAGVWFLPGPVFAFLAGLVLLLAGWEWTRLIGLPGGIAGQFGYLAGMVAVMVALGYLGLSKTAPAVGLVAIGWWCLAMLWLGFFRFAEDRAPMSCAVKALAGLFVLLPAWALLSSIQAVPDGPLWVLLLLAVVWAADISAYFAGRRFGRRRLAPRISPGKTWAGVYGAVAGALLVGILGGWWLETAAETRLALLGVILVTVAFSVVGDLFESLIKRQAGAKDSSSLLPGHGGVFDRLDSLFAAVPVFYWGFKWLNP